MTPAEFDVLNRAEARLSGAPGHAAPEGSGGPDLIALANARRAR